MRTTPKLAISIGEDGARRSIYPIYCSRCRKKGGAHWSSQPPFQVYAKFFYNKGWELGREESSDLCPECVAIDKEARRAKYRKDTSIHAVLTQTEAIKKIPVQPTTPVVAADAPQPVIRNPNAAFGAGATPEQLRHLQRVFNDVTPTDELAFLHAQFKMFERQMATFRHQIVMLEQRLGG